MAIDPIKLDDLTWSEMVVAARRRIAAVSGARWTLHSPVDPGVTLLELFAWLLEQRVYWMDQVPDALLRGALTLLGEKSRPTQAATTVMRFATPDQAQLVPEMTELTLLRSAPPIIFSTRSDVLLLPFEKLDEQRDKLGLFIAGVDRTPELERGRVLRLFPADGKAAEVKIALHLREFLPQNFESKRFSLLFDLRDLAGIVPQWSPDASSNISPPARIAWFYSAANGQQIRFDEQQVGDGTGGLRRSGVVTLPIKPDWKPEQGQQYALWLRVESATFSAPPRLERLIPNVVSAAHTRKTEHELPLNWLPLPGNTISLADLPEGAGPKDHPPIEETVKLSIRERDDQWHDWSVTGDLAFHGPSDRVFVVDRERGEVRFGDGLTGRLPVLAKVGAEKKLKVQYSVGGGNAGKVGANRQWNGSALNVVPSVGGAEPETMAAARERMAAALRQHTRAITREDYEELARTIPGLAIKRARAAVGVHPNHPCVPVPGAVTVFIVPDAPREDAETIDESLVEGAFVAAPQPDPGALAAVRQRLNEARLVASELFVLAPRYRPVALTIEIETDMNDRTQISARIKQRLSTFLDPLIGGDDNKGWPFGEPLRPAALLREAQRAVGDQGRVARVGVRLLDPQPQDRENTDCCNQPSPESCVVKDCAATPEAAPAGADESCNDIPIGAHDLVELKRVTIRFARPAGGASNNPGGLR